MNHNVYQDRFQACRDKEDFVDLCIDLLGALGDADYRIAAVIRGQESLMQQTVRIRRAALGLQPGEPDTAEGIDTEEIVRNLRERIA